MSTDCDFSKCAPHRCYLPLQTAFFFVGKLMQWKEEEIFQYATEFEFPETKDTKITIEKGTNAFCYMWAIRNSDKQIFDHYEHRFIFPYFKRYSPNRCYPTLEHAFYIIEFIRRDYEKFKIDYNGRCTHCGEYVGKYNLKETFGFKVCQECCNKFD